ncbi:hypothetical protein ACI78Q_22135 [Geodermatophilus sp. SYSU D00705]
MVWLTEEERHWIIQPLLDAGLELEEICELVFRLSFEILVNEGPSALADLRNVVEGQPGDIQAAWVRTIDRMITVGREPVR